MGYNWGVDDDMYEGKYTPQKFLPCALAIIWLGRCGHTHTITQPHTHTRRTQITDES